MTPPTTPLKAIPLNTFRRLDDTVPQRVNWASLKMNTPYSLELIAPFDAVVEEWGELGAYMKIAARVLADQQIVSATMIKDELIVVDFAMKTFDRMWQTTNRAFRLAFKAKSPCNVTVHFTKKSERNMTSLPLELSPCTPEQLAFAQRVYGGDKT